MLDNKRLEKLFYIGVITAIVLGLYFSSLYSYLLFHSLIEIITIAISFALFILTWNARGFLSNDCLKLLGIGYVFIALIDLFHTLAYKGMNVFPDYGANLPTQLWIAARYLQAITLCITPFFVERRVDNRAIFGGYAVTVTVLVVMIYSGNFPVCYIEGIGLTPFKINSEYVITALLLVSLPLFYRKRSYFKDKVFFLIIFSIVCTALSEISFTAYISVYGFANLVGHFFKLAAFYLIYQAILVTGFKDPFDLIFRDLKQAEETLRKAHNTLEEKVRERTAELRVSEERNRSLIREVQTAIVLHDHQGSILTSNPLAQRLLGLSEDQLLGKSLIDAVWHFLREDGSVMSVPEYPASRVLSTRQPLRDYVTGICRPDRDDVIWALVSAEPEYDDAGEIVQVLVSFVDITERKRTEEMLHRLNRELRAISNCNQTLLRAEDEQFLLDDICRIICDEAGYRMAWVGYAENDIAKTVRPIAWGGVEDGYLANANLTWADTERGRGPSGTAIRSGESTCIQNFTTDSQAVPWREGALQRGYRSSIALPLKDENTITFGVLNIYSTEPNAFTPREIRLLEELAGDLAFGVTVLRGRDERKRAEAALRQSEQHKTIINQIAHIFLTVSDEEMYSEVLAVILQVMKSKFGLYGFIDANGDLVTPSITRDIWGECQVADKSVIFPPSTWRNSLWGRALREKKAFYSDGPFHTPVGHILIDHFLVMPIIFGNEAIGLISVANSERSYTEEDKNLLEEIANYISPILKARLQRNWQEEERKRAENALRASEQKYRTIFEESFDGLFITSPSGKILDMNKSGVKLFGYDTKEEVLCLDLEKDVYAYPPDRERILAMVNAQGTAEYEVVVKKKGGEQIITHCSLTAVKDQIGAITTYRGIIRDITESKRAEEALRASEEHLRAVVSGTPVILFVFDQNGVLTLLQGRGLDVFGNNPNNYIGKSIGDAFVKFIPDIQERFQQALIGEDTGLIQTIQGVVLDVRYSPLRNKTGEVSGIIGVATNITERMRVERLQIELEKEQEVIALKERFITTASHDFRTPLAIIKTSANMLENYFDRIVPEERVAKLRQISVQVDRMARLLGEVLTLSQASAGKLDFKPERVMLKLYCQQIWEDFQHLAEQTHRMDFVYDCDQDLVFLDPNLVHYVLANLLSNAIKYSPVNGQVLFEVICDGDNLIFRVSDNGIGIPEQDQTDLFQPFHRATNTKDIEGTGLGLSIVKSYVEVHHGHIDVESKEGQGTTFTVFIPVVSG